MDGIDGKFVGFEAGFLKVKVHFSKTKTPKITKIKINKAVVLLVMILNFLRIKYTINYTLYKILKVDFEAEISYHTHNEIIFL